MEWTPSFKRHRGANHLAGRIPAEAWKKIDPYSRPPKEVRHVTA